LKLPEEALRAKLESAEIPWLPAAPVVAESRAFHDVEWGKLAIPYLTMSGQGDTIELRGAVPTNDMRSLITEDAVKFYEGKTVKSDIKLADAMRSDIDPSPTLAEWPEFSNTETTGILAFALVGKSWKRISARSTPSQWSLLIPEGFTAAPALADLAMLSESLKHRLKTAPPPAHLTAPYVALSALGSKVDVKGEVASEEIKTQLASEIAKAFSGLLVTMDLRVSNRVIPVTEISQTIETIPDPPTEKGGGLMAFAPLGRPWRLLSADPSVADQLRAPWVGLVENGFDTLLAQEDLTELARHFRKTGAPGTVADALPLAHVSLAIYQGGVHLSGEVSSMAEKREILAAAKAQWPDVDRHDEIRPSGAVQPAGNWTQAFAKAPDMPEAGKNVLGLLVAGRTWSEHTIEKLPVDVDSLSTTPLFPGEEERVLAMGDFGAWIAEMNQGAKPAPKPVVVAEAATTTATETAFVDLMAMENEVTVDGEVADEATKAAILDELVKRWNGWTIKDGINVMPNVKPVTTLEATLQSIPDPPAAGTRLFAAAKLGLPMRKDLIHSITLPATAGGISRDQQLAMLRLKAILKLLPAATFRVVGHTDSDGAKKKNESLSLQRAETVAKYLSANGIPSARLQTKGAGSTEPVADNTTPEGRMKNRRVDISLK
jgi:hypothetical protein